MLTVQEERRLKDLEVKLAWYDDWLLEQEKAITKLERVAQIILGEKYETDGTLGW